MWHMAHSGHRTHGSGRQLSGEDRSRQLMAGAAVRDPSRHFTAVNYRIAKGSFDHLISLQQELRRHFDAKRLRGLQIDHELEFGRL
jgi:hypothetical protein